MKNYFFLTSAALIMLASCSMNKPSANHNTDTLATAQPDTTAPKALFATMQMKSTYQTGDSVQLKFTVYNPADSAMKFCKWHTPFEPLMSKYLNVTNANGEEANYKGPMAKRIMPPPADSYITVAAKDSLLVTVNLLKAYDITKPGKYTVTYAGQNISGLNVKDSVSFEYR